MFGTVLTGVLYHWIGGFSSATNFIPFRGIRRWSWEIYWVVQGVAAWLVAPLLLAGLLVPHLFDVLRASPPRSIVYALLFGALWGVGGLTFGLSVRYLGIALGYGIALGMCAAFGTLIPPIYTGEIYSLMHERSGVVTLAGVLLCLIAVGVNAYAGQRKEREVSPAGRAELGESEFSISRGLLLALFAGLMSSFFAFGLQAGAPIALVAKTSLLREGHLDLWQNLPVLVVVLWGGFATNLIWCAVLTVKNRSAGQFLGAPGVNPMRGVALTGETLSDVDPRTLTTIGRGARLTSIALFRNYGFASLAGIVWYFQFFFYSLGQTKMGRYDFASWTLHMASIILFATLWGVVLKEWLGTRRATKLWVAGGITLLVLSTLVVGYGAYLKVG